jgi:hypothetical protein
VQPFVHRIAKWTVEVAIKKIPLFIHVVYSPLELAEP